REANGGTPVADATIEARAEMRSPAAPTSDPDSGVARAKTDAKGHFRLAGLAPGMHTLIAFARGVGRAEKRGAPAGRPVDLNLIPGGTISGTVTGPKNKPVEGAAVRAELVLRSMWSPTLLARTDAQGAYVLPGVP